MLSETTPLTLMEQAITELEYLALNTYMLIRREEYERSKAITNGILEYVFGGY